MSAVAACRRRVPRDLRCERASARWQHTDGIARFLNATNLIERVLPEAPARQRVLLSLAFAPRCRLAYDAPLASTDLGMLIRAIFAATRPQLAG